ncbi:retrovirus-related Pol polyprotein from transposon 17.6 [Trichonephila clavipes]|nr:retrovirus-related Pol polyprotein from transposon 17.6 [Trichonephila clavipes]
MSEKALVDHIFVRLEPQVQDYVEVRNPQNAIQFLEVLAKFEERYSCKATRDSRNRDNVEGRGWKSVGCLMLVIIEEIGEILKWCVDRIMVEMIIGVIIRIAVKEISGSRAGIGFKMMIADLTIGDINLEIEVKMTILVEGTKEIGVRVKILVEAEENKCGEVIYIGGDIPKIFFYKQVKKSSTPVITAQGAKCRNIGVVELNIRIREFEKPWLFHELADLEYPCILGINFIGGSKIILDFDRKYLAIPDSQINKVVKTVGIDLSKTKLEEKQKRELQDFFNSFQGLLSDKPGLTHVLYHEIDTKDNPPVVSRPYRYDRVKQEILDYHVDKMLKEGTIIPIQSPYASPVVLCRKNNRLPPDNPEAYRFAVDYRTLNAITKYPRYPLPLIDDLIMNIPHTGIKSALDLRSGYFQMAVNPSDIVKTAFVTKNGTYAFHRMPFGLSGVAPNFRKQYI